MIFTPTRLPGAYVIDIEPRPDERGFFARAWDQHEFEAHGLNPRLAQANLSFNKRPGTLRGLHYQVAPYAETKLVRCTRGAIWDVIVDLRPEASSYGQFFGAELTADNHRMLYVPEGFAHGFITLTDNAEVTYQVSQFYTPGAERGLRWNDQALGVEWPVPVQVISEKDAHWPDWTPAARQLEKQA